jgi:hypothetical protein
MLQLNTLAVLAATLLRVARATRLKARLAIRLKARQAILHRPNPAMLAIPRRVNQPILADTLRQPLHPKSAAAELSS